MLPPTFGMEGLELFKYVKGKGNDTNVIFITSKDRGTTEIVAEAMKLGATDFLDKHNPLFFDKLLVTLEEIGIRQITEDSIQKVNNYGIREMNEPTMTTILFLAADPTNASRLRLGQELREIQEKLQLAKMRDEFKLEQRMSVRPVDISQAILDEKPKIVHFSGHGTNEGSLCFENEIGKSQFVEPDALASLFELVADHVDCVLLNACYSEIQAKAIANHIKYVIGMNKAIGDKAAISFAIGFYQALGAGKSVEDAYKFGCVQIRLQSIPEHLTPVLIKNS
jgi:YesN/AraC family two-component response regulator